MIKAITKQMLLTLVLIVPGHALAEDKAIPDTQSADAAIQQSKDNNSSTIEDKLKAQKTQSTTTTIQTAAVNLLAYIKLNLDRTIAIIGIFIALFLFLVSRHSNKKSTEEIKEFIKNNTAEKTDEDREKAQRTIDSAKGQNLSHIASEIVETTELQILEQYDKAISKWLAIATATEKNDKKTASMAYFSAAYLIQEYKEKDEATVNIAIDLYSKSIGLHPAASAYNNRGALNDKLGEHGDAIDDYTKAIKLKPDYPAAYYNRGVARSDLDKYKEAITDFNEAIRLKPDFTEAYTNRGAAKSEMGKHKGAIADFNKAIRISPDGPEAYNNRGNANGNLGKHEEAIADFNEAIRLKPDYTNAILNRGLTKSDLGRHDEAITDYSEAIKLDPDLVSAYIGQGVANASLGKYDEALADLRKVLELEPRNELAKQAIAEIEARDKND